MTNDIAGILPAHSPPSHALKRRGLRGRTRMLIASAAVVALAGGVANVASAAPGDTSSDTTEANVVVESDITLTALTEDFELIGLPGDTVTGNDIVSFNVRTNNLAGYTVTVQSADPALTPAAPGNADVIPIVNLRVREQAPDPFTPLSSTAAVTVHTQTNRSAEAGDSFTNDYQVAIPFVNEDTYTATLNYIATTL